MFQHIDVKRNSATEATDSSLRASAFVAVYIHSPTLFNFRNPFDNLVLR